MKNVLLAFALVAGVGVGCGGSSSSTHDMGSSGGGGGVVAGGGGSVGGGGGSTGGGGGGTSSEDGGSKGGEDGGAGAYGAMCTVAADCESGMCDPFAMGKVHRCTISCNTDADCPAPAAGCTAQGGGGHCKFTN